MEGCPPATDRGHPPDQGAVGDALSVGSAVVVGSGDASINGFVDSSTIGPGDCSIGDSVGLASTVGVGVAVGLGVGLMVTVGSTIGGVTTTHSSALIPDTFTSPGAAVATTAPVMRAAAAADRTGLTQRSITRR